MMILNCHGDKSQTYEHLKPNGMKFMDPNTFDKSLVVDMKRKRTHIDMYKSSKVGLSCDEVSFVHSFGVVECNGRLLVGIGVSCCG